MDLPIALAQRLDLANQIGQRRKLSPRAGVDFSSNDYLGFSQDPELHRLAKNSLEEVPTGSAGSRLLRGNLALFEQIEDRLARYCGRESALLYPSGYQANVGLIASLLSDGDAAFSDQLNHASIVDGIRLSRADKFIFPHNDLESLERQLEADSLKSRVKVIVTESLFSMEGDFAPLAELSNLARKYGALLVVDESHATGLYGDFGNGLGGGRVQSLGLTSEVFATVHTGGKALGVGGAWVCGSRQLRDYLVNFSRAFIFSTAMSPWMAVLLDSALLHWSAVGAERVRQVQERSSLLLSILNDQRCPISPVILGPIIPVIIGDSKKALEISHRLCELGFDVRSIRPPTIPKGTARLRVSLNAKLTAQQVEDFGVCLGRVLRGHQ